MSWPSTILGFTAGTIRYNEPAPSSCTRSPLQPVAMKPLPCALVVALLVLAGCVCPLGASAQAPVDPSAARLDRDQRPIEYWLEQLDSDQFSHRQLASQQLNRLGDQAVGPLVQAAQSGKLELTQRALEILQSLAAAQAPDDESGAWAALNELAGQGSGSAAVGARAAIDDLRRNRESQAYHKLSAAGVQIGLREYVIHSRAINNQEVVWIDKKWKGDIKALSWLRWVKRVEIALIDGEAVRQEVLEQVVKMPDLRTIVMRDATVRDDIFAPLSELQRIDELEFRYVRLGIDDAEKIARLPVRGSLGLMGTGIPPEGKERIADALPGLRLEYKEGGFLGVICNSFSPRCQIDGLKAGGAAANAGLEVGDVIVSFDGEPIRTFDDLQVQIAEHPAGAEIQIVYERQGETGTANVTLGRLDGE